MNLFLIKQSLSSSEKTLSAIFLSALIFSAFSAAESGTVTFSGRLVEDVCDSASAGETPQIRCYRDGKWKSQPLSLKAEREGSLPYNIGTTHLRWIDQKKKTGIMTINYR